jgi:hypothetical protein
MAAATAEWPACEDLPRQTVAMILRMLDHGLSPAQVAEITLVSEANIVDVAGRRHRGADAYDVDRGDIADSTGGTGSLRIGTAGGDGRPLHVSGERPEKLQVSDATFAEDDRQQKPYREAALGKAAVPASEPPAEMPRIEPKPSATGVWDSGIKSVEYPGAGKIDVANVGREDAEDAEFTAFEKIGMNLEGVADDLERIQAHVFRRRTRVLSWFRDFDKLGCGRCTRDEFARALAQIIYPNVFDDPETPIDVEALADHFTDKGGDGDARSTTPYSLTLGGWYSSQNRGTQVVDYMKFSAVMDEVFNVHNLERQPEVEVPPPGSNVLDAGGYLPRSIGRKESQIPALLHRIAMLTETRGISLATCFNECNRPDSDVRSGRIDPEMFAHQFPLAKSTSTKPALLTRAEVDMLIHRYCDDNGWFRLTAFEKDIEAILGQAPDAAHDPERIQRELNRMMQNRTSFGNPLRPQNCYTQASRPSSASMSTRPPSESFASSCAGSRPQSGARPQSARAGGSSTARQPVEAACWMPLRAPKATTTSQRISSGGRSRPQSAATISARLAGLQELNFVGQGRHVEGEKEITGKIKNLVRQRRIRLYDVFRDRDRYCRGVCNANAMRAVLAGSCGFQISAQEYDQLLAAYPAANDEFCYSDLCAAVGEPHPPASSKAVGDNVQLMSQGRDTPVVAPVAPDEASCIDGSSEIDRLHDMIAAAVRGRGLEMLGFFVDFEKKRWATPGHVTVGQFYRAMDNLNIRLTQAELSTLCSVYCDTYIESEFNFMAFCAAVDPTHVPGRSSQALREKVAAATPIAQHVPRTSFPNPYFDPNGQVRHICAAPPAASKSSGWRGGAGNAPAGFAMRRVRPKSAGAAGVSRTARFQV